MIPDQIMIKAVKPVLSGYIAESLKLLKRETFPDEEAVHDIRVFMKRARAAIKLISIQADNEFCDREYKTFRDAGRLMAEWRETSVQRKTLKAIRKSNRELFVRLSGNPVLEGIFAKPEEISSGKNRDTERIEKIEDILRRSLYRVRFQSFAEPDFRLLFQGLDKTYNEVARIYLDCRNNPKPQKIHTFRKRAKDFLYQLWFFRPLNPPVIKSLEKRLDNLTQNLGKYNDVSQIISMLGYKYGDPGNTPELNELVAVLKGIQDQYLIKVWPVALELFRPGQKLQNLLGFKLLIV